ncbi:MAG TPA: ABC transporter substrate-binding protein [Chloroflexota bacterium]|nr:ABC transporter substrate-binding protein [Chloroflexota bacterium]
MVKVVLTTFLLATWLLQSCANDDSNVAEGGLPDAPCVRSEVLAKPAGGPATVRVGVTGALSEAAEYLADAEGYFAREGLRAQMINFPSANRMLPALASGQIDVGSANVGPGLFNAAGSNLCVKVVSSLTRQQPQANSVFLFARRDLLDGGKLHGYGDLRGMQIAIGIRDSSSEYALAKLLQAGGLALTDVHIQQMGSPAILVSLANKSIDAAVLPEATASLAEDKGLGLKWKPVAEVVPDAQFGMLLFSPRFAAQRDAAVRWMTAYLQAARDYDDAFFKNIRREEIVDQLVKSSPIKDSHLYDHMGFAMMDPNGGLNMDSVADQMRWLVAQGEVHQSVDLTQLVDMSYAQAAVERLGAYQ